VQISPEWEPVINAVIADPGITVVVGTTDAGKTTFCHELLNASARAGVPAALIDSDMGQSEIGPPGTIGLALPDGEVNSLKDLPARRLYFVGSTSPVGHLLPTVVGTKRLAEEAIRKDRKLIVVDTTGLVRGAIGWRLKTYKIDILQPRHLIGIQRTDDVEHILAGFAKSQNTRIHRVPVSAQAGRKPQEYRATRRRTMFFEAFHSAQGHILHLDQVVCRNTSFTAGRPLGWRYVRDIEEMLSTRVLHAEAVARGLYVVTEGQPDRRGAGLLAEHYGTRDISIVPAAAFQHVLLGLSDATGLCIDIGLLHAVDFKQRYMFILSRIPTISPVRIVQFGSMRVSPDGIELGRIRPGEI